MIFNYIYVCILQVYCCFKESLTLKNSIKSFVAKITMSIFNTVSLTINEKMKTQSKDDQKRTDISKILCTSVLKNISSR